MEFAKAAGHWQAVMGPLYSLSALLRESIGEFDEASDMTLRSTGTIAACESIARLIKGVLSNLYVVQSQLNDNLPMTNYIADEAEKLLVRVGGSIPPQQLELFEDYAFSS